ncbi:MAG: hypothetical protein U1B80_05225, partial [Anaerolineaceae bacterium]|nr:hypothetical protein [Anaerolineaceae bacterium]
SHGEISRRKQVLLAISLGGVILLMLALYFALRKNTLEYSPEVTGAPSLRTDQVLIDLGNVQFGTKVQAAFGLQNVGDQDLRFSEVPSIEVREGC